MTVFTIDATTLPLAFNITEDAHLKKVHSLDQSLQAWFLLPDQTILEADIFFQHYRKQGIQCFSFLPHCFSGFLYDHTAQKWIIAVDRFGSIPLYYTQWKNKTYLSDKIESLIALTSFDALNPQSILAYFYFHFIPSPLTYAANIKKLIPGNAVIIQGKQSIEIPYVSKKFSALKSKMPENPYQTCFQLLEKSVAPYATQHDCGVFLSGGLDSSTLTYLLAKSRSSLPAFSIFFQEKEFDESLYAKLMSEAAKAQHHTYMYDAKTFMQDITILLPKLAQPFGNLSIFPCYQVAKMAKQQGIHTLIAGDGGDEIFGGNQRYLLQNQYQILQNAPTIMRQLLLILAKIRYSKRKYERLCYQLNTAIPLRLYTDIFLKHWDLSEIFTSDFLAAVDISALEEICLFHYTDLMHLPFQKRLLQYDWRFTLSDNDLFKVKQACEIAGVEVVFPYLSPPLVEYVMSLPPRALFTLRQLRPFFHKMVKPHLPETILNKPKHGFGLPFGPWLKTNRDLQSLVYTATEQFKSQHILQTSFLDELLLQAPQHPTYYSVFVWLIAALQLWQQAHPTKNAAEHAAAPLSAAPFCNKI